jgi:hypothetical protein
MGIAASTLRMKAAGSSKTSAIVLHGPSDARLQLGTCDAICYSIVHTTRNRLFMLRVGLCLSKEGTSHWSMLSLIIRRLSRTLLVFSTSTLAPTSTSTHARTHTDAKQRLQRCQWSLPTALFDGPPPSSFPEVKRPKREADYSTPDSVEVRMSGDVPLFPFILAWHGQRTLLQRCNSAVLHPTWP